MEDFEDFKVLIFGASGFIGSKLVEILNDETNYDVFGFNSSQCDLLDVTETRSVLSNFESSVSIIFLSAVTRIEGNTEKNGWKNLKMLRNLLSVVSSLNVRNLIFTSSTDVYGLPPEELPVTETTSPSPDGFYGFSKLISEEFLRYYPERKFPATVLRLPGIYGPCDRGTSIIGKFIRQAYEGETIELSNQGETRRDFVEVEDLIKVILNFLADPYDGVVNVAKGKGVPIKIVPEIIEDISGLDIKVQKMSTESNRDFDLIFQTDLLNQLCPQIQLKNLRDGINKYIQQFSATQVD